MINIDNVSDMSRGAMTFMAMYENTQESLKWSSNVWDGDCRDDEKILCNRFPLKHEVRERGRGEMLYENIPKPKCHRWKTCKRKYN